MTVSYFLLKVAPLPGRGALDFNMTGRCLFLTGEVKPRKSLWIQAIPGNASSSNQKTAGSKLDRTS